MKLTRILGLGAFLLSVLAVSACSSDEVLIVDEPAPAATEAPADAE